MLVLIPLLVSCATMAGCVKTVTKLDVCKGWEPIYVGADDVLTDQTAKELLVHNRYGIEQGCWTAPKKKAP